MTTPSARQIWTRNFLLIFLSHIVFSSAYCILIPTLPVYFLRTGSTEIQIGVLIGTLGISSLVLRPFIGRALVRISERRFMMAGALLFALGAMGYLFTFSFWILFLMRVVQGVGSAFIYTAAVTWVARTSPETRLGQSLSYYYVAFNVAFAVTPSFGMFLINHYDFTLLFAVCAGLATCSLFVTAKLRRSQDAPSPNVEMKKLPLLSRETLPTAIVALISSMTWGSLTAFFPLYALSWGVTNPGLFFTAFAVTIVSGRALGARILDRHNRERLILPCLIASILAAIILLFSKTLLLFLLAAVIWGMGNAFLFPALVAYTLDRTGSSRGPAMGTFSAFDEFGTSLGAIISGIILRLAGYPTMFLSLVLFGALNVIYFHFFVRRERGKGR
jgi:MFS family permease